jgi:hypothetical protein
MSQYKKSIVSTENNDKDYSMTVIIVFIGLIIGYFCLSIYNQERDIEYLKGTYTEIQEEMKEKEGILKQVQTELKTVDSDEFVEKQAREKLKMVKSNEKVFIDTNRKNNIQED